MTISFGARTFSLRTVTARSQEELLERELARCVGSSDADPCPESEKRLRAARRMHHDARTVGVEDRVKLVLTGLRRASGPAVLRAIVPFAREVQQTGRPRTEISAERPSVSNLRRPEIMERLVKTPGSPRRAGFVLENLDDGDAGTNPHAVARLS